jgi:hypothetical protein
MSTLTLKNRPVTITTVPLEDWYEELADESLDPLNQLIAEEDAPWEEVQPTIVNKQETITMSTTQVKNQPSFDINAWMNTLAAATETVVPVTSKVINKPDWLEVKGPLVASNAFAITAGIVKAARRITDGLFVAKNRLSAAIETLAIQEARACRQTPLETSFGPLMTNIGRVIAEAAGTASDAPGFNPDGQEFEAALEVAEQEVEKLEQIVENGTNMLAVLLDWIDDVADELHLEVETGHTVTKDLIGNEFRKPRYSKLDRSTLMYGIAAQKEFIRNARGQ